MARCALITRFERRPFQTLNRFFRGDFQRFVIFGGFISETVRDVSPSAARRAAHFKLELSVITWRAPCAMANILNSKDGVILPDLNVFSHFGASLEDHP